jgi:hypothetical protein
MDALGECDLESRDDAMEFLEVSCVSYHSHDLCDESVLLVVRARLLYNVRIAVVHQFRRSEVSTSICL